MSSRRQSILDGKKYTVNTSRGACFELHTENAGTPYEVLLTRVRELNSSRAHYGSYPYPDPLRPSSYNVVPWHLTVTRVDQCQGPRRVAILSGARVWLLTCRCC